MDEIMEIFDELLPYKSVFDKIWGQSSIRKADLCGMNKQECKNIALNNDYSQGSHSPTNMCCKYMECTNKGTRKENACLLMLEIWENNRNKYFLL